MKNVAPSSIAKFIPIVLLILVLPLIYNHLSQDKDGVTRSKKRDIYNEVSELVTTVKGIWEEGLIQGLSREQILNCSDIPAGYEDLPLTFFKCNPGYLNCYLSQNKVHKNFNYLGLSKSSVQVGRVNVLFELKNLDQQVTIQIEPYCHEAYLPQKIYAAGHGQNKDYIWDNNGRDYFIDKFYVNRYQKKFWETGQTKIELGDDRPVLNLTLSQMKQVCGLMGKSLLESRLFDAATFYPSNIEDHGYLFKSHFPWSKKTNDLTRDRLSENVSWIGLYYGIGENPEVFINTFEERANLKVSAGNEELEDPWHRLGLRGYWDGEGFEQTNFDLVEQYSGRNLAGDFPKGVAFRCSHLE